MSDIFTKLETIKKALPASNGYREDVEAIERFFKHFFNIYRILKSEHNCDPIMENVDEEINRFETKWGQTPKANTKK